MNKKKLLVFVKSIDGGTGTFILDLLHLNNTFDIKTLVLERPTYRKTNKHNFIYWASEKYYPEKYYMTPIELIKITKEVAWFKNQAVEFKPDLVLTVDSHCLIVAQLANLFMINKFRLIATMHNNLKEVIFVKSPKYAHSMIRVFIGKFLNRTSRVVCTSKKLAEDYKNFFKLIKLPTTIYYGLKLTDLKKPKQYKKTDKTIISVARLDKQKDHITLIKAFSDVKRVFPKTKLWLVGDGPARQTIENLATQLNLKKSVKFYGWVQNPNNLISRADLFVLSTNREGFGYVLVEAMKEGVPVISSDAPYGPNEILGDGKYGILTPVGHSQSLTDSILKLMTNKAYYNHYAKMSLHRSRFFSIDKMIDKYLEIIDKTLKLKL